MKILFVAPRFHTNQVSWVEAFLEKGHKVEFHSLLEGHVENYSSIRPKLFPVSKLSNFINMIIGEGGVNSPRGFPKILNYFKFLKNANPDIVLVRDISRWFSLLAALLARLIGIKVIIYSQTNLHKNYSFRRKYLTKLILFLFQAEWITPIKGNTLIQEYKPLKGMHFIPFAVEVSKTNIKVKEEIIDILTIGKFETRKNQLLLIKALEKIRKKGINYNLTIIGEVSNEIHRKNLKRCDEYIVEHNLSGFIKIRINIAHSNILKFYGEHDLFVLPATEEPASISVLESLGQGTPAICSDTNGTRFYLIDNCFGLTFKDNCIDSLCESIELIVEENKLADYKKNILANSDKLISKENFYNHFMAIL